MTDNTIVKPDPSITLRPAQEKDIPALHHLLRQVLEVHAAIRPDIFISGTAKYTDDELRAIIADENRPLFVAAGENGLAVAHAFCVLEEVRGSNNLHDSKTLYIDDICVDQAYRGQHIAAALYQYVKDYAQQTGCTHITLNVWEGNTPARKFYEAMGLHPRKTMMEATV